MPVIETSIDKAWGFLTYFFHTLSQDEVKIEVRSPIWIFLKDIMMVGSHFLTHHPKKP
ncbi:hypothetical protein [Microcoleus sp. PH2017_36_ELK_O_B]|uniref:hypothetical protein n=1 Tax=Microcoleus sp. PH2017_36_ELK_O_B TaxID=2798846 RepID=UPI001DA6A56C|nr:hypothetical protein [Microcoleus sp. PH2017_36_ELK_O_B]MCC3625462.1 hypothetical protein [Microcoleus sp. PH2017_36_ELK_O_B]